MNKKDLKKFDKGQVLKTYQDMSKQFEQIFTDFKKVKLPNSFKGVDKILVCGMGGSALGPDLVRSVFQKNLLVPISIVNDYNLPKWVDQKTLIVISSFSGNTEEIISCYKQAQQKKLKIFVIASGGELEKVNSPKFIYNAQYNYAQNPRFAVGYSIAIFISLLKSLKLLDSCGKNIRKDINYFNKGQKVAETIASKMKKKIPVLIASEHLLGNMHVWQNQINETGKNFASYFAVPEICHHQFEGLSNPINLNKNIIYILVNSRLYHPRNQKRYQIMKEILKKKKINFVEVNSLGDNVWKQSMYLLGISSYSAFYLAYYNKIDPQPNPWVDFLKEKMKIKKY
jgi:glucose/mannose-6-phosphate isomerase